MQLVRKADEAKNAMRLKDACRHYYEAVGLYRRLIELDKDQNAILHYREQK